MDCLEGSSSSSCAVCGTVIQCAFTPCTTACLISFWTRITQQPLMRLNQWSELSLQLHQTVHLLAVIWWKVIWKCFYFEFKLISLLCAQIWCPWVWGLLDVRFTWWLLQIRLQMAPLYRAKEQWQWQTIRWKHALLHEPSPSPIRSEAPQISWWQCNLLGVFMHNNGTDRQPVTSH